MQFIRTVLIIVALVLGWGAVRADPALGGVRLVAVSGDSRPPAGVFDACLAKPVGPADLRQVLGETAGGPGA